MAIFFRISPGDTVLQQYIRKAHYVIRRRFLKMRPYRRTFRFSFYQQTGREDFPARLLCLIRC